MSLCLDTTCTAVVPFTLFLMVYVAEGYVEESREVVYQSMLVTCLFLFAWCHNIQNMQKLLSQYNACQYAAVMNNDIYSITSFWYTVRCPSPRLVSALIFFLWFSCISFAPSLFLAYTGTQCPNINGVHYALISLSAQEA